MSSVNIVNYFDWFSKLNQLSIPGINPTWPCCIIPLHYLKKASHLLLSLSCFYHLAPSPPLSKSISLLEYSSEFSLVCTFSLHLLISLCLLTPLSVVPSDLRRHILRVFFHSHCTG